MPKIISCQTFNYVMAAVAVSVLPLTAHAKQCEAGGGLQFLGTSANGERSVWVSGTTAGEFKLEAAQGNQAVDTWSKNRRGLHVSLSPVFSNGNGGTHKLYSSGDNCLLDTKNQKNGFVFPPIFRPPSGWIRPPDSGEHHGGSEHGGEHHGGGDGGEHSGGGDGGEHSGGGDGGEHHGGGGGKPPSGLTPSVPGGVTPPIGTLPPVPITPTVPGGVTPPIGALPVTPITPTVPGSVTPPIGTLPPVPITPGVPGGVMPPIGTLPVTPITPTVPGGVTPPIGTLPVTPITPTVPGGVTPPIGTLPDIPPTGGGTPEYERTGSAIVRPLVPPQPCRGVRPENTSTIGQLSDCSTPVAENQAGKLPPTPGRELVKPADWNTWVDGRVSRLSDQRDGMDTHGNSSAITIGLDRTVSSDLVAGLQLSLMRADGKSFEGDLRTDSTAYSIGPYLSWNVSPDWLIYGAVGFGRQSVETSVLSLNGTSDSGQYSLSLQAEGQYALGSVIARPKIQLSHTYTNGDSYQLQGIVLDTPITLNMRNASFNYGVALSSLEINRTFDLGDNRLVMPYIEAGVYYEYARPQSGQHLTGSLAYAESSPWGGVLHAGVRSLFGTSTMASLELGYQSLGVTDLSIWEFQLLVSHAF